MLLCFSAVSKVRVGLGYCRRDELFYSGLCQWGLVSKLSGHLCFDGLLYFEAITSLTQLKRQRNRLNKKNSTSYKLRKILSQTKKLTSKLTSRSRKKKKPKRSILRYMFRPIILLTGQPILFTWSIKRRRITFTYNRFLKTYNLAGVSKTMALCLCIKEPSYFLIPYSNMLTDLDMFSHRRLLRLAQSSLYWFVLYNFGVLLGFYFSCSGKISVGGNSRTRTMLKSYGYKSTSLVTTQTTNTSSIINTVTGCLGLLLIFFY